MSMEHPPEEQHASAHEESDLHVRNRMQMKLADRFYGFESDEKRLEWIERHSDAFRAYLNSPAGKGLFERFKHDEEQALHEVESMMYVEHPHS